MADIKDNVNIYYFILSKRYKRKCSLTKAHFSRLRSTLIIDLIRFSNDSMWFNRREKRDITTVITITYIIFSVLRNRPGFSTHGRSLHSANTISRRGSRLWILLPEGTQL